MVFTTWQYIAICKFLGDDFDRLNEHLRMSKKLQANHGRVFINSSRLVNYKESQFRTQSSKSSKIFPKNIIHYYIYKDIFKYVLFRVC